MTYAPADYTGNTFFGQWNKLMLMQNMLFNEDREKHTNQYAAEMKAELEMETIPVCFN
mgnify:CR=1 FL=1